VALARGADVWLESSAPGELDALGLGAGAMRAANPALVYVSITPYGQHAPDAATPATDLTLAAAGGLLAMMGDKDRPPVPVGFPETTQHGAIQAAADAVLALYERSRSGEGQHLDTSTQAAVVWMLMFVTGFAAFGQDPPTFGDDRGEAGRRTLEIVPGLRNPVIEPCKDGHVAMTLVLGAQGNHGFGAAMRWAAENDALDADLTDRDWSTWLEDIPAGRLAVEDASRGLEQMLAFLRTRTKAEIQAEAVARKMLIAPAYTASDLLADPQLAARGFWQEVDGCLHPGPFARLSRTPIRPPTPAPRLGADQALLESPPQSPRVTPRPSGRPRGGIFEGLRVADLGWIAAGPLITKELANHGATVISLESETRVDTLRFIPPWKDGVPHVDGGYPYANMNQSKLGVACNYAVPESRAVIERLIDWADVVVENYTPGTAERLGFGWEQVRARRPDAVMLSTCMRGQTGPEARHTGFGLAALVAALMHRDATGEGQYIDLSQIEASLQVLSPVVLDAQVNRRAWPRAGHDSDRACPHAVVACRGTERYLAVAVADDAQWRALRSVVRGLPGTDSDDLNARIARRDATRAALAEWAAEQDAHAAGAALRRAGVPAYAVLRATDLHADEQLAAHGFFVELDHPRIGRARFDGAVTVFSATPARPTRAGPTIGQHTWETLRDVLGFDEDEIARLAAAGALS
ncbi:MAG TPA: hypothetical protein ENO23_01160, partial [Alphaproteobacteria bacterium]|nr:hypothetical protein [Alphaproteobacteria bacterium]